MRRDLEKIIKNRHQYSSVDEVFEDLSKLVSIDPSNDSMNMLGQSGQFKHYRATGRLDSKRVADFLQESHLRSESFHKLSKGKHNRDSNSINEASNSQAHAPVLEGNAVSKKKARSERMSQQENPSIEEEWPEERKGITMPEDLKLKVKIPGVANFSAMLNFQHLEKKWTSIISKTPKSDLRLNPSRLLASQFILNEIFDDSMGSLDGNLGNKQQNIDDAQNFKSMKNLEARAHAFPDEKRRTKITTEDSNVREGEL